MNIGSLISIFLFILFPIVKVSVLVVTPFTDGPPGCLGHLDDTRSGPGPQVTKGREV